MTFLWGGDGWDFLGPIKNKGLKFRENFGAFSTKKRTALENHSVLLVPLYFTIRADSLPILANKQHLRHSGLLLPSP